MSGLDQRKPLGVIFKMLWNINHNYLDYLISPKERTQESECGSGCWYGACTRGCHHLEKEDAEDKG